MRREVVRIDGGDRLVVEPGPRGYALVLERFLDGAGTAHCRLGVARLSVEQARELAEALWVALRDEVSA
jgi:hypothetical protein